MREVRLSPDGTAVAIRTDEPDDGAPGRKLWGTMSVQPGRMGGRWSTPVDIESWTPLETVVQGS